MTSLNSQLDRGITMRLWRDKVEALSRLLTNGSTEPVIMIQTHISAVLLGKGFALKLKKPVNFGFLDYTTLDQRRTACEAEIHLNRRLCPDTYIGVEPVVEREGELHLDGEGRIVDYAVLMKRLPEERMLHRLVESGTVTHSMVKRVAERLANFHRQAPRGPNVIKYGSLQTVRRNWDENFEQMEEYTERTISPRTFNSIRRWVKCWLETHKDLLEQRVQEGRVCDGHGDVRCESICIRDETLAGIAIFDCIEFNDRFRCGDVAGEVAFLASDLDMRGRPDLGYLFTEEYSAQAHDELLFSLLPFYRCYRAFVRGKVLSFRLDEPEFSAQAKQEAAKQARRFFEMAERYATPLKHPTVIAVAGLSGTGKTALSRAIAGELGLRVVSSDAIRTSIFGKEKQPASYGAGSYTAEANRLTYQGLLKRGRELLRQDGGVILDATFLRATDRAAAHAMAAAEGAHWRLIVCKAPAETVRTRLSHRAAQGEEVSDADWNIYLQQREQFEPPNGAQGGARLLLDTRDELSAVARASTHWLRGDDTP